MKIGARGFVLAGGLLLSGCGGVSTTPAPVTPFPVKTAVHYDALTASIGYQGTIHDQFSGGTATILPTGIMGHGGPAEVDYDATTQTYQVISIDGTASFASGQQTPSTDYSVQFKNGNDSLYLYGNAGAGAVGTAPVALSYASFAVWSHVDPATQLNRQTYFLIGEQTPTTAMPTTGTASYSGIAKANVLDYWGNALSYAFSINGTATMTADFGAGTLNTTLTLDKKANGQNQVWHSPYTGTGTISGNGFAGTFSAASGGITTTGAYYGDFFGPGAKEAGYTFYVQNTLDDPYAGASLPSYTTEVIAGVVVAKKN